MLADPVLLTYLLIPSGVPHALVKQLMVSHQTHNGIALGASAAKPKVELETKAP